MCTLQHCFQFCVMSIVSSELYGISMDKLFLSNTRYSFEKCFEFCSMRIVWNSNGTFSGYDVIRLAVKYVLSSIGILRNVTTTCCQFLVTSIDKISLTVRPPVRNSPNDCINSGLKMHSKVQHPPARKSMKTVVESSTSPAAGELTSI